MAKAARAKELNTLLWTSVAFTVLLVLISASFQSYFFLSPSTTYPLLGFFQTLYTTAWFVLVVAPILVLLLVPYKGLAIRIWLIIAVALFPVAVIGVHVALASAYGNPYIDYLGKYPILLVSHLLIPAAYVYLFARKTKEAQEESKVWPEVVDPAPHDNNWQPTEIHHY